MARESWKPDVVERTIVPFTLFYQGRYGFKNESTGVFQVGYNDNLNCVGWYAKPGDKFTVITSHNTEDDLYSLLIVDVATDKVVYRTGLDTSYDNFTHTLRESYPDSTTTHTEEYVVVINTSDRTLPVVMIGSDEEVQETLEMSALISILNRQQSDMERWV